MLTCTIHDVSFEDGENCPQCEALVEAQVEGLELVEARPKQKDLISVPLEVALAVRDQMNEAIGKYDGALEFVAPSSQLAFRSVDSNDIWEFLFGYFKGNVPEELTEKVTEDFARHFSRDDIEVSETFGFYLDGYTLSPTDKIGEVTVTRYDGKSAVLKSKSLTDYFDRRIDPHNEGEDS